VTTASTGLVLHCVEGGCAVPLGERVEILGERQVVLMDVDQRQRAHGLVNALVAARGLDARASSASIRLASRSFVFGDRLKAVARGSATTGAAYVGRRHHAATR
jgi:hypothetical protein